MILQKTGLESNHHDVPFKYLIILFASYTSIKLKKIHVEETLLKKTGLELKLHDKPTVTA